MGWAVGRLRGWAIECMGVRNVASLLVIGFICLVDFRVKLEIPRFTFHILHRRTQKKLAIKQVLTHTYKRALEGM